MNFLTAISTLYKILKLIPQIKNIVDGITVMWFEKEIENMREADVLAIKKAIYEKDQRDLEKQIGSTRPGAKSGIPGTEHRNTLPNVDGVRNDAPNP